MKQQSNTFNNLASLKNEIRKLTGSKITEKTGKIKTTSDKVNNDQIETNKNLESRHSIAPTNKKTKVTKSKANINRKPKKKYKIKINESTKVPKRLLEQSESSLAYCVNEPARDQVYDGSSGLTEVVIGLDFGTATSKVVVMEQGRKIAWAIPFTNSNNNPYLLPSTISLNNSLYSLDEPANTFSNLKMPLLRKTGCSDDELANVTAYLALIIHRAREWFLENAASTFPGFEFDWLINLGLPAADYNDETLVSRFHDILLCSANLSFKANGKINRELVLSEINKISSKDSAYYKTQNFHPEAINVIPEIAAELHGYVSSDQWDTDRPKFMLVDIGGSTVDASIVNVIKQSKAELKFNFLKSAVTLQGTAILHQKRLEWIDKNIDNNCPAYTRLRKEIDNIAINKNLHIPLPEKVNDYLDNARFPGQKNKDNIDHQFYEQYGPQLYENVITPVRGKIDSELGQWGSLQFLLCGGGSLHPLYNRFINAINKNHNTHVKLDQIQLEKPENLRASDLKDKDYHRLSVAYGLAHEQLGRVIRESNINEITPQSEAKSSYTDNYISKDQI
ncbi:hypothetical protein J7438_15055 [Thalassotalea sp. G20_0]|uniref:hypothetical protein n=1 Tax=Thalassotalea sp. G20_0 TaxID=2821093 RepID=UPI001AD96023|nr:hypothetical protein [Thalassotalea sp. G20_0]MBO9495396.1 hypothetical protein [Thalassotalea sp. G20_0]